MKRLRDIYTLVLLACAITCPITSPLWAGTQYYGLLEDTAFSASIPIKLEVLESGDTAQIMLKQKFSQPLPTDTVWNLCFTQGVLEKCFELRNTQGDSTFSSTIGSEGLVITNPWKQTAANLQL